MRSFFHRALAAVLAILVLGGSARADECLNIDTYLIGGKDSKPKVRWAEKQNWQDWIWRGPEFLCNIRGKDCTYSWSTAITKSYAWTVGGGISIGSIPILGKIIGGFEMNGSYSYTKSYTETFNWSQIIKPGYRVTPIQVVLRRWSRGYFVGGWVNTKRKCSTTDTGDKFWYIWNNQQPFGEWSGQVEEGRYGTYWIWK